MSDICVDVFCLGTLQLLSFHTNVIFYFVTFHVQFMFAMELRC